MFASCSRICSELSAEFEAQVRVFGVQALHQRQRIEARQRHHAQAQRTDKIAATRRRFGLQTVISGQHRACPGQHPFARRGETFEALAAIDQRQFEFFFEAAQAHGQGRLGDMTARGGLAEVSGFVEGDEEFELLDVHLRSRAWAGFAILALARGGVIGRLGTSVCGLGLVFCVWTLIPWREHDEPFQLFKRCR